jgi:hypothetical protein
MTMSQQPDRGAGQPGEALEVLRAVWSAQGQTSADLDEQCGTASCRRMADINFDGMAAGDADLRTAWRARLAAEGKLNPAGGTLRDLVLDPAAGPPISPAISSSSSPPAAPAAAPPAAPAAAPPAAPAAAPPDAR